MAVKRRGGLGKGLDSLIRDKSTLSDSAKKKNTSDKKQDIEKSKMDSQMSVERKQIQNNEPKTPENDTNKEIINENMDLNAPNDNFREPDSIQENISINTENEPQSSADVNPDVTGEVTVTNEDTIEVSTISETEEPVNTVDSIEEVKTSDSDLSEEIKSSDELEKKDSVLTMKISLVEPNRDQPRKHFSEEGIEELASSIKQYGIIQPLLVQKHDDYYEIIAGERRWRAAMKAGLKEVPVIVKDYTSREAVEISLIENIQREDLNPIEEALAYDRLIQEFELTQEQVAGRVSKSRSSVTNSLRLLKLADDVRQMVISGDLSEGHARTLLGLPNEEMQTLLAERIIKEKLSVRDTEKLVKKLTSTTPKKTKARDYQKEAILGNLSEQLKVILGTKVSITEKGKSKGKIEIEYYSDDELNRIFEMLQSLG